MADDLSQYGVVSTAPQDLSQYGTIDTPKPGKVSQAISNIPASAMRAASNAGPMSGIPSQQTIKPGHDDPKSPNYIPFSSAENFMGDLKSLKDKISHFMEHPVDNAIDMFVKDPVVSTLGAGALLKNGYQATSEAASAGVKAVADTASSPITRELVGVLSPRAGNALRVVDRVRKAFGGVEEPAYPPIYDEISKGLGGGAYETLSAEAQHAIQSIAQKLDAPKVSAPAARAASAPLPEAASTPGLTVNELITKELEAKRGIPDQAPIGAVQRPVAQDVGGVGVPLRPPLAQPSPIAATPEAVPPTPSPTLAPTVSPTLATPPPTAPTPIDAGNPIPEAYRSMESSGLQIAQESNARSGIANKLAEHLHKNGITTAELDIIDGNPEAMKLFWDNASQLPGLSKQTHYSASPATIAAAKVALKDLEGTKVAATADAIQRGSDLAYGNELENRGGEWFMKRSFRAPGGPDAEFKAVDASDYPQIERMIKSGKIEMQGAAKPTPADVPAYLSSNPKALNAAKAMAQEMMKPTSIGEVMGAVKKARKVKK